MFKILSSLFKVVINHWQTRSYLFILYRKIYFFISLSLSVTCKSIHFGGSNFPDLFVQYCKKFGSLSSWFVDVVSLFLPFVTLTQKTSYSLWPPQQVSMQSPAKTWGTLRTPDAVWAASRGPTGPGGLSWWSLSNWEIITKPITGITRVI